MQKIRNILILLILLISICMPSYAIEEQPEIEIAEYSYDYQKWLELPEEEKEKTIAPAMYTVPLNREEIYNKTIQDFILKGESIPAKYTIDTEVPISNQGQLNLCWAYTSNLVLQTTVQKKLRPTESQRNYSEKHMDYSLSAVLSPTGIEDGREILNPNGLYRDTNKGGSFLYATGYWVGGRGPILEEKMPYTSTAPMSSVSELDKGPIDVQVNGYTQFATIYKKHNSDNTITYGSDSKFTTTYSEELVKANRDKMKMHIMENGAIEAAVQMNNYGSYKSWINKDKFTPDHAVTIIGWDDNYAVSNFGTDNRPLNPGAWLCANSWGANWGEKGTVYISYEDALIESELYGITDVEEVDYDHIYQYDMLGTTSRYRYSSGSLYAVNIFNKENNGIEELNAVTVDLKDKYNICEIYVNQYNDDKNLSSFKSVGTIKNGEQVGYMTLKLENPIKIYGNKWGVMVKITSEKNEAVSIGIEKTYVGTKYQTAIASEGESFFNYQPGNNMRDVSKEDSANIAIKARTVELVSNETINFESSAVALNAGKVLKIKIGMTEEIEGTAPTLRIKCGNGAIKQADFVAIRDGKILEYNYTISQEDNGKINLIDLVNGNLTAKSGRKIIYDLMEVSESQKIVADNVPPNASVTYNVTDINKKTNQNIVATIKFDEENVTILNNYGKNQYIFSQNGTFTFEFQDQAGNEGTKTVTITTIDKEPPKITMEPNGNLVASKSNSIKVTATDSASQIVGLAYAWKEEGKSINNENFKTFTNGQTITKNDGDGNWNLVIYAEDEAGNKIQEESNIFIFDNTPPTASVTYNVADINKKTNQNIIATISFNEENVTIKNNGGKNQYTFNQNGTFTFEFQDQAGNVGAKTVTITAIDKEPPKITMEPNGNLVAAKSHSIKVTATDAGSKIARLAYAWQKEGQSISLSDLKDFENGQTITKNDGDGNWKLIVYAEDEAGNKIQVTSEIFKFDNTAPIATITYNVADINKKTNQNIVATISFNEENVTIKNNRGSNQYTFEQNGTFTFEFQDQAGNVGTQTITINLIDKAPPEITMNPNGSTTSAKSHSIKVTAVDNASKIVRLAYAWQKEGKNINNAEFKDLENGQTITKTDGDGDWQLIVYAEDEAGNKIQKASEIFKLDNTAPIATIKYNVADINKKTNQNIVATITFNEENVTILNNGGSNQYTFEENGTFTFEFQDQAGNTGSKTITITAIDRRLPKITMEPNGNILPAKTHSIKVTATGVSSPIAKLEYAWQEEGKEVNAEDFKIFENGQTITKADGDGNWRLIIYAEDESGNQVQEASEIFIFDNTPPTADFEYTEKEESVIATIKFNEENVTILNNDGKPSYTFVRNGSFKFRFKDALGNIGEQTATVDKLAAFTEKDIQNCYDIITENSTKYIKINQFNEMQYEGNYTLSMREMVNKIMAQIKDETNQDKNENITNVAINSSSSNVYVYNSSTSSSTAKEDDTAKTGMILKVGDNEYTMVCIGDLNGDGKTSATDLSKMKLEIVGIEKLPEEGEYAADLNGDGKITATDLSNIKLKLAGL